MKEWEYRFTFFGLDESCEIIKTANEWSKEGWRLISVHQSSSYERDNLSVFFGREKPEPSNSVISPAEETVTLGLIGRNEESYKKANGLPPIAKLPAKPSNVQRANDIANQKCRCGHKSWMHSNHRGACDILDCKCQKFREPPPAEPDNDDMSACGPAWHDDR